MNLPLAAVDRHTVAQVGASLHAANPSLLKPDPDEEAAARNFGDDWDGWSSALLDFGIYEWAFREPSPQLTYLRFKRLVGRFSATATVDRNRRFTEEFPLSENGVIEEFRSRDFGFEAAKSFGIPTL